MTALKKKQTILTFGSTLNREDTTGDGILDVTIVDGEVISVEIYVESLGRKVPTELEAHEYEKVMNVYWNMIAGDELG